MTAAALIAESRKRAGLTQAELAGRLDSHQSVIARWETGRTSPDFDTVVRVVRAAGFELGVSIGASDDHDLALIRRELKKRPDQRLASLVEAANQFEAMAAAVRG